MKQIKTLGHSTLIWISSKLLFTLHLLKYVDYIFIGPFSDTYSWEKWTDSKTALQEAGWLVFCGCLHMCRYGKGFFLYIYIHSDLFFEGKGCGLLVIPSYLTLSPSHITLINLIILIISDQNRWFLFHWYKICTWENSYTVIYIFIFNTVTEWVSIKLNNMKMLF